MNKLLANDNEDVSSKISEIREAQVMLDSDLAILYKCANRTIDINKVVKRNIMRFPKSFCFQLTRENLDIICLRSQIVALNNKGNKRRYLYIIFYTKVFLV